MPAPTNANGLSLGRPVIDPTTDDTATLKELLSQHYIGAGFPCGARDGDDVYMAVYAQSDGGGAHILYGGNPTNPTSPHVLTVSAAGSATVIWQEEDSTVITSGTANFVGAGVTVSDEGDGKATITIPGGGGGGGSSNSFETWSVSGGGSIVADSATDTATVVGGTGITITATAGSDTLTFDIDTTEVAQHSFKTIAVSGQSDVVADSPTDTLTLVAAGYLAITTTAGSDTVTFTATGDGVGYDEIQEEGAPLTKRAALNFISERVTAADNAVDDSTDVTFEYYIRVYGTTTTTVTAATTTFDVDGVSVIQGDMPELTGGQLEITNSAKIPIADENEAEFRWNEDAGVWETEPLKCHMIKGLATAAVTGGAFTIDNIELICGSDPRTDPSSATEAISIGNPFAWDIDNNGVVVAVKKANGDWIAIQAACPA